MSGWNGMTYDGKDTVLRMVRQESDGVFALVERPEAWEARTACADWQVRDIVGHLVDTTESYFERFDAARGGVEVEPAYGVADMAQRAGERGRSFRDMPQPEMVERLRTDFDKMLGIFEALTPEDWVDLQVPHFYMGPLPAFFYPAFQLMDYAVHSWDIRQGTGRAHGLTGEAADLLVPFMFVLWQATTTPDPERPPSEIGIHVTSGPNAGGTRVHVDANGMLYEPGDVDGLSSVIEFDPGSFVLTTFGRSNSGTIRGDRSAAERYLNLFFRI